MKILINERQYKKIKESELKEKLGVPSGILDAGEKLYNRIISKIKSMNSLEELEKGFIMRGKFEVGDHKFNTIKVGFNLEIDPEYVPEVAGIATYKKSKLTPKFTLQHVDKVGVLELQFNLFVTPETTMDEIVSLFDSERNKSISSLTHELGHSYYDVKKRGEKSTERSNYDTFSSRKFGQIDPLNDFIFYSYYIHAIENIVRPGELAQLLRLHGITQKEFLDFFQKSDMYKMLKTIQTFTLEVLKERLKNYLDDIKQLFSDNDVDYQGMSDDEIIEKCLELLYINLVNWKSEVMKRILTTNFFETLLGFSGDKGEFFRKYTNNLSKYQENPIRFYEVETQRFNYVATKMIKKLSKLYDYLTHEEFKK